MEALDKNIKSLVSVIKKTDVYKHYKKQEEILKSDAQLWERVYQFRIDNFQLQNEAGSDNLFHVVEQLCRESAELRRNPVVNAYLDAELALCKMMQMICREVIGGVDLDVPQL